MYFEGHSHTSELRVGCVTDTGEVWLFPVTVKWEEDDLLNGRRSRRSANIAVAI